jgi:hypothetical protein
MPDDTHGQHGHPRDRGICGASSLPITDTIHATCTLLAAHAGWHRADNGMSWSRICAAEYQRPGGRQHGDRIVRCDLLTGHDGDHEETATGSTWPRTPEPIDPRPASMLRRVDFDTQPEPAEPTTHGQHDQGERRTVTIPLDTLRALWDVYETWTNTSPTDPGDDLVSHGVKLTGIVSLLGVDDAYAMEAATDALGPHETLLRQLLDGQHPDADQGERRDRQIQAALTTMRAHEVEWCCHPANLAARLVDAVNAAAGGDERAKRNAAGHLDDTGPEPPASLPYDAEDQWRAQITDVRTGYRFMRPQHPGDEELRDVQQLVQVWERDPNYAVEYRHRWVGPWYRTDADGTLVDGDHRASDATAQAEARGWNAAVKALLDYPRYEAWVERTPEYDGRRVWSLAARHGLADYLEAVGPGLDTALAAHADEALTIAEEALAAQAETLPAARPETGQDGDGDDRGADRG